MKADIPATTDLLGKHVTDLQTGVKVKGSNITGTIKYVTGYTGFSGDPVEQAGNYIALHVTSTVEGATISVNGNTLDSDGIIILRIVDKNKPMTVVASKAGYTTTTDRFNLAGLTLDPST